MSNAARNPERVWFIPAVIAAALAAIGAGYGCYSQAMQRGSITSFGDTAREELATLSVPARETTVVERSWVTKAESAPLISTPLPMPCAGAINIAGPAERSAERFAVEQAFNASKNPDLGARIEQLELIRDRAPDNLLVVLMLGTQLIEAGELARAERLITDALKSTGKDEQIIAAARDKHPLDLRDVEVSTLIHLEHACVVAGLLRLPENPSCVVQLRNVIGSVKPLSHLRLPGATRDQPTWSRLAIPAPGCAVDAQTLSTIDLYNNLIVAYMNDKLPVGEPWRTKELIKRLEGDDRRTPLREFLKAQVKRASDENWENETQLGALSNVETVLDWVHPDVPQDARFDFNAVLVLDRWTGGEQEGIAELRDKLIEQALHSRNISQTQQAPFARGILRMLATSNVNRARVAEDAAIVKGWLGAEDARALDDLLTADAARAALPRWLVAREEDQEAPHAKLGVRSPRWYAAAISDFAAAAAQWAAPRSVTDQRHMIVALHQLLGSAKSPAELVTLEKTRKPYERVWLRLSATRWFSAAKGAVVALLVWLALLWILVHYRERRLLRTSFYNIEYELLSKGDSPRTGRSG